MIQKLLHAPQILAGVAPRHRRAQAQRWAARRGHRGTPLPRVLGTEEWVEAFERFA